MEVMVQVFRQVRGDTGPVFVRYVLGDGSKDFVNGLGGQGGPQHRDRPGIVFDDDLGAGAHAIQERCKITRRFRVRDVDHTISHTSNYTLTGHRCLRQAVGFLSIGAGLKASAAFEWCVEEALEIPHIPKFSRDSLREIADSSARPREIGYQRPSLAGASFRSRVVS